MTTPADLAAEESKSARDRDPAADLTESEQAWQDRGDG